MKKTFIALLFCACANIAVGQVPQSKISPWPVLKKEMQPWTRWWWMGNAVDEKGLAEALTTYHDAGIGGVEITPIYGAKGFEQRYIDFLSPKWMSMLNFTVTKAASLNMGVDMNTGTGWPFGGPQVTPEFAASKFIVQQYQLQKGQSLKEPIILKDPAQLKNGAVLQAVTAYGKNGAVLSLFNKIDQNGQLKWKAPSADWEIYALFSGKTLQAVKRAAPGGAGFTLDHLDQTAVNVYLNRFDEAFKGKSPGVRAFFNDSYEVYGANWTLNFLKAFKELQGYDLSQHLKDFTSKDSTSINLARLKSDYRETMSIMLLDNFTKKWTNWAHHYQSITKNQSHGSPGNLIDLYAAVDIPETETFGSSYFPIPGLRRDSADVRNVDPDPIMNKFSSSAAHVTGKTLVSSETFTWLSEHFKTSFSQAKPEAEALFLSGINHIFYHGTTYTPPDVPFPGWLFYASTNMVPANSLWPHLKGMNAYFSRCQSILQAGQADNELLIYWPVYDQWNNAKGMDMPMKVHDVDVWLHPTEFYKQSLVLQQAGYAFDFASDRILENSSAKDGLVRTTATAAPYQTLIIPELKLMPLKTLKAILALAQSGSTVIFQKLPEDVPGLSDLDNKRREFKKLLAELDFKPVGTGIQQTKIGSGTILLSADLPKALAYHKLKGEQLVESGLKFIRRKVADGKYYYLVNHTAEVIDTIIPINQVSPSVLILDPQSGDYGLAACTVRENTTMVKVHLESGESLILKTSNVPLKEKSWVYLNQPAKEITLAKGWKLDFTSGGPELPVSQTLSKLGSWTASGDAKALAFSGTATYTSTFVLPAKLSKEYVLKLGKVYESAQVWINGKDAGILWSIPYETRIGQYLVPGKNTIKIEVANLMANRIRDLDQRKINWRNYNEINFVNINYKPFDAAGWEPMPSGLVGPVTITGFK
ncbi:glycosyl hydrolase [Pedobacter sp.]|uniref:glycosyl hydrolase n=1 Tax=Pedobacter sp. TaxID=1411316 RepID=UPI003D7FCAC8